MPPIKYVAITRPKTIRNIPSSFRMGTSLSFLLFYSLSIIEFSGYYFYTYCLFLFFMGTGMSPFFGGGQME
jgi:hypothetical protein